MRPAILLCLAAQYCTAQTGGYVVNAIGSASSRANVLAPGMLATVTDFGSFLLASKPLTFHSANVSVRQIGASAAVPATVVIASGGTVTFIVPLVPYGPAQLSWQIDNARWQWINVSIAPTNFELARIGAAGPVLATGPSIRIGLATPTQSGQTVSLTGSGLGIGTVLHATVGGMPATVLFAGRGAAAGNDDIRIRIPEGIKDSCYAPLVVTAGGSVVSSTVSVTSDGLPCRHPFNLSVDDMKTLDGGGTLAVGEIDMSTSLQAVLPSAVSRQESVSVRVVEQTATDLARYFTALHPGESGATGACSAGAQVPTTVVRSATFLGIPVFDPLFPAPPSLGDSVSLQSPTTTLNLPANGSPDFAGTSFDATLPAPQDGTLTDPPRPVVAGGKWTWSSPGSADLAPSTFGFGLAGPLQLEGAAPLSLRRGQDQTIRWNGAGFDASATITLFLNGHSAGDAGTGGVICTAPAQSGTITIPAALLSPFAPASIATLFASVNTSSATMPHALFKTKSGATLLILVSHTTSDDRQVDLQ